MATDAILKFGFTAVARCGRHRPILVTNISSKFGLWLNIPLRKKLCLLLETHVVLVKPQILYIKNCKQFI